MAQTKADQERQIREAFVDGYTSALDRCAGYTEHERHALAETAWREENTTS